MNTLLEVSGVSVSLMGLKRSTTYLSKLEKQNFARLLAQTVLAKQPLWIL